MIKTAMAVGTAGVFALVCAMPAMAQAPAARPQPARVKGPMWPFGFQGGVERGRPLLGAVLPRPRLDSVWSFPVVWIGPIRSGSSTSS